MPLTGTQTFTIYQSPTYASLKWDKAYTSYSGTGDCSIAGTASTFTLSGVTRNANSSPEAFYAPGPTITGTCGYYFHSDLQVFKPS